MNIKGEESPNMSLVKLRVVGAAEMPLVKVRGKGAAY